MCEQNEEVGPRDKRTRRVTTARSTALILPSGTGSHFLELFSSSWIGIILIQHSHLTYGKTEVSREEISYTTSHTEWKTELGLVLHAPVLSCDFVLWLEDASTPNHAEHCPKCSCHFRHV